MNPTILKRSFWSPSRPAARTLIVAAILGATFPALAQTIFSERLGDKNLIDTASDGVTGRVFVLTEAFIYAILPDGSLVKNNQTPVTQSVTSPKAITARDNQVYVLHGEGKQISWYEFQASGDASQFVLKKTYTKPQGSEWTDLTSETAGIVFAPYKEDWGVKISCIDFRGAAATEHKSARSGLDPNASWQEIIDPKVSVFNGAVYASFLDRHLLPGKGDAGKGYWDLVTLKISPELQNDGKWALPIVRQTHLYLGDSAPANQLGLWELRATDVALVAVRHQNVGMGRGTSFVPRSLLVVHLDPNTLNTLGEASLQGNEPVNFSHVSMAVSPANDLSIMAMATKGTLSPFHGNYTSFPEISTTTSPESYILANLRLEGTVLTWKHLRRIGQESENSLGPSGLASTGGGTIVAGSLRSNRPLKVGTTTQISGPGAFYLQADDSDLTFATDRHLTVQAKYHRADGSWGDLDVVAGSEIKPFLGRNRVGDDQRISIVLPERLYLDGSGRVVPLASLPDQAREEKISAPEVVTRFTPISYSVNTASAPPVTGEGRSVEIVSKEDTSVTFFLSAEHAVIVDSAVQDVGLARDHALALGNPEPAVKKHWVAEHEILTPKIDGIVQDLSHPGSRYVVAGYQSTGFGGGGKIWDTPQARQQIEPFSVTGPTTIRYLWKRQHAIQVGTSSRESEALTAIRHRKPPIPGNRLPEQADPGRTETGVGTFWIDHGEEVWVGAQDDSARQLSVKSILSATGSLHAANGLSRLELEFDPTFRPYRSVHVPELTGGAYLTWDFGNTIYQKLVPIGGGIDLTQGPTKAEIGLFPESEHWQAPEGRIDFTQAPEVVSILEGPPGTNPQNAGVWNAATKRWFPTRPVRCLLEWPAAGAASQPVVTEVTAGFSGDQVRHPYLAKKGIQENYLAQDPDYLALLHPDLPAVDLDPDANDQIAFVDLPFSSSPNSNVPYDELTIPAVLPNALDKKLRIGVEAVNLDAGAGKHVLVFTQTTAPAQAKGDTGRETVLVKVLKTERWDSKTPEGGGAVDIGKQISSPRDMAGIKTGFITSSRARYNVNLYDRSKVADAGPIFPVNTHLGADSEDSLTVIWYARKDAILWPYVPVSYTAKWPDKSPTIVIAQRTGSEGADPALKFDPELYSDVQIYHQPDRARPGFNPNEEHALIAPSFQSTAPNPPPAAFALRAGDLNLTTGDGYTSECRVLVQYFDKVAKQAQMAVYQVSKESDSAKFSYPMKAGEPVQPPYPLPLAIGLNPCRESTGGDGDEDKRCYWEDHRGQAWAISDGALTGKFYYRMREDFWLGTSGKQVPAGTPLRFLPLMVKVEAEYHEEPQPISYQASWPGDLPILKAGETLTFAGGEYHADHPDAPGLPGVIGWKSGRVVYDSLNSAMNPQQTFDAYAARLISPLEERRVRLTDLGMTGAELASFRDKIQPSTGLVEVDGIAWRFAKLSASLKKRIYFDPLDNALVLCGFLNDKELGDSTLTQAPPPVYVLEPNILTPTESQRLRDFKANPAGDKTMTDLVGRRWNELVDAIYAKSRNPENLRKADGDDTDKNAYYVGLESSMVQKDGGDLLNEEGRPTPVTPSVGARHKNSLGPGLALVPGAALLKPGDNKTQYVTLVENDDPKIGGPVRLHIVKMEKQHRYRGAIQTVLAPNIFEEKITLRHTGDFGGNADDIVYEWYYREENGAAAVLPPSGPWTKFASGDQPDGAGLYQIDVAGSGGLVLGDNLFFLRYRHKDDKPLVGDPWAGDWANFGKPAAKLTATGEPGRGADGHVVLEKQGEWAGAGNSPTVDGVYRPQLVPGWIKRVLDRINPYEARFADFRAHGRPAGYVSMIQQAGGRYEGPVALNADKDVIENVGLIELYQTLLERGKALSIDLSQSVSTPGIHAALQMAATRVQELYLLLGHEAYADAQDPALGFGSHSAEPGSFPASVWPFLNQTNRLIEEELGLLRGVSDSYARPVYNRFYWNFTKSEGEAAYAVNYNLSDENRDGFIDEKDAMLRYPQGHGDAWGHYSVALKMHYDLLRNPHFNWQPRAEFYNLNDVVIPVDFLDERKFARAAAARAKAGAEITELTWKAESTEGARDLMEDSDPARAWGVKDWARRAGQGAYLDWITANSLIPAVDEAHTTFDDLNGNGKKDDGEPTVTKPGQALQRVDRTSVDGMAAIPAEFAKIETVMNNAERGLNPLGLTENSVPFDIDPVEFLGGNGVARISHFQQIHARAVKAAENAAAVFAMVGQQRNQVREQQNSAQQFVKEVVAGDRDLRNRLIDLFGTPHEGNIGLGKPYPPGYLGPDLYFYMYVDVKDLDQKTVPEPGPAFTKFWDGFQQQVVDFKTSMDDQDRGLSEPEDIEDDLRTQYKDLFSQYFFHDVVGDDASKRGEDSPFAALTDVNVLGKGILKLNYPTMASGYSFQAPVGWGHRGVTGELQSLISDLVQAEADLALAVKSYESLVRGLIDQARLIEAKHGLALTEIQFARDNEKDGFAFLKKTQIMRTTAEGVEFGFNTAYEFMEETAEAVPSVTGVIAGTSNGIILDPSALEEAGSIAPFILMKAQEAAVLATNMAADILELVDDHEGVLDEITIDSRAYQQDIREALKVLEGQLRNEASTRIQVFQKLEALRQVSDSWRSKLHQAHALLLERQDFNRQAAGATQELRYQDMAFRILRNDATQSYREAFDLAARYAFLAAQAYDYDTNLNPEDAGSARGILGDILSARTIGTFEDGEPVAGTGDLANVLAKMRDNFAVMAGQLGINNAQAEDSKISLRHEFFRIPAGEPDDAAWITKLNSLKKADLWDVPEFRRYCRPFASRTAGKQPGLVIEFKTSIESRKNVFGKDLQAGDHAFDPTLYATKIHGVGVWFTGYQEQQLAKAPRVYLVPVGDDIMTVPDDWDLKTRTWNVADQCIPVPHALNPLGFRGFGDERRFSSFRAYGSSSATDPVNPAEMAFDTRLVGRSVWNTKWLLIIPSASLLSDEGIEALVDPEHGIRDIQLCFKTFGFSGN